MAIEWRQDARRQRDLALSGHRRYKVSLAGAAALTLGTVLGGVPGVLPGERCARADGAFPDGQSVLLPRDRPQEIILATNFGLVSSVDDGKTWAFSCEATATVGGARYVVGPPSSGGVSGDRLFAISTPPPGAPLSTDDACSWAQSQGAIATDANPTYATDVFPDPSNPARVFLLATPQDPPSAPGSVYRSLDGGATYQGPLFTPPVDVLPALTGVEVSASSGKIVYATWYDRVAFHPHLARSADGGDTWTDLSLDAQLGPSKPYLAAVDPDDPQTVYLRLISAAGVADQHEALAVTHDAGASWTMPVTIPGGAFQALVRRQDGTVVALGQPAPTGSAVPASTLYRSTDGGQSFGAEALRFHGKGLAERSGTLFMATDNAIDLVALVSSTDGVTWTSRLRFEDISAIKGCVYATCRDACDRLLGNAPIFSPEVCSRSTDAAGGRAGGGGAQGTGATGGGGGGGGGCAIDSSEAARGSTGLGDVRAALAFALLTGLLGSGWRRDRRR
jgi:hypothetical protein